MKVRIFMDASASTIEAQINTWLDGIDAAVIVKTDTVGYPRSRESW